MSAPADLHEPFAVGAGPPGRSHVHDLAARILTHVRTLVLSDVHADAVALERVLEHVAGGWDRLVLLGDLIGYGPEPVEVVTRLRELGPAAAVRGNHESMLQLMRSGRPVAATRSVTDVLARHREALVDALGEEALDRLTELPLRRSLADLDLVHGHPDPASPFDYLLGVPAARRAAPHLRSGILLYGHTHVPGGFREVAGRWRPIAARGAETVVQLEPGIRLMLNPGSVAAARDGGPGGCYLLLDQNEGVARVVRTG